MVMHLYRQSLPIDTAKCASEQFFAAMIQYGDGGILKGEFTFPDARKTFREVLPHFDRAIETFDPKQRLDCMEKIYEISRPLWIKELEKLRELIILLKKLGKCHNGSTGNPNPKIKPSEPFGDPGITGLSVNVIAELVTELGPLWRERQQVKLASRPRKRAVGAPTPATRVWAPRPAAAST